MSRKVILIASFLSFYVTQISAQPAVNIYIKPLKCEKQSGILISESDMSQLFFAELDEKPEFNTTILSEAETPFLTPFSDFLINGNYRVDDEIFTVNYQIESGGGLNRHQNSVTGLGLAATQKVLKSQVTGLFVSVNFLSIPQPASLKINNFPANETPQNFPLFLIGKYQVSLVKPGFVEMNQLIDVTQNQLFTFELLPRNESASELTRTETTLKDAPAHIVAPMVAKLVAFEKRMRGKITIYVLGAPEIAAEFEKGIGKSIGPLTIEKIEKGTDLPSVKPSILFIGDASKAAAALEYTEREQIMSATGIPALIRAGVALGIGIGPDGKPKILINLTTSAKEKLEWNPAIYEIAQIIK